MEKSKKVRVHTTKDYSVFKFLNGNRETNKVHLKHLEKSMKEQALTTIITVNENLEIIDGQHRFEVLKGLGLPINFIIEEGYGLREIQVLNRNNKKWGPHDYVKGYCDLGYKNYLLYRKFYNKYKLQNQVSMALLVGTELNQDSRRKFTDGEFKVVDYDRACLWAERINKVGEYFEGYTRRPFIYALIKIFNNEKFIFSEFLHKLKMKAHKLNQGHDKREYTILIEEIYNWNRRNNETVSLRY